ncbi:MAG: YicC family protein [Pararhodobacter sp.]
MTGFAALSGEITTEAGLFASQWDLRGVNGRGLDMRFRLPDWLEGLEPALRKILSERLGRGSVTVSLKLSRCDQAEALRINPAALDAAIAMIAEVETRAGAAGLGLAPMTAADLLALRGVVDTGPDATDPAPVVAALLEQAAPLIDAFDRARREEGRALAAVIDAQIDQIDSLATQARAAVEARRGDQIEALKAALSRLTEAAPSVEPARFETELALIAVKTDVTEELDRLDAHVDAARALMRASGPIGRKLDFLMQEFNREANTLCSKAQNAALTRIGLDLKTVIDQMREQIQNLE